MTNLNKTKEEIIYELLLSLNKGDSGYFDARIELAEYQYNNLVKRGVIKENDA